MQPNEFIEQTRNAWQTQPGEFRSFTATLLRRTSRRIVWESRVAAFSSFVFNLVFALVWAGAALVSETPLCRIGCALLASGNGYVIYSLIRFRWLEGLPQDRGMEASVSFYRAQLVRRRDFLANPLYSTWLPQAPGVVLGTLGWFLSTPDQRVMASTVSLFWIGLNLCVWRVNQREAARLQREIGLLDA